MPLVIERVIKLNKREVPDGLPPGLYWEKIDEYVLDGSAERFDFYFEGLEYLDPYEILRVKAKALIWQEVTGSLPVNVYLWREYRNARRRGDMPHTTETASSFVDEEMALHCGCCDARWSAPYPSRCKLCDRVLEDAPDRD